MAEVMPRMSFNHLAMDPDRDTTPSPRHYSPPEPNPPFVFPMQPDPSDVVDSVRRGSNPDVGRGRHARSSSRPQQLSLHSLPAFEFHPSASSSVTTQGGSPARSPTKMTSGPAPPSGHRRNGSGFIGGDTRSGGLGLVSTSPTAGEGTLPQPSTSRTGPPVNRRGHSHRRSGAISSHDLSMILNPPNEPRGSSAPTTPSNPSTESSFPPHIERAASQPITTTSSKRNASIPSVHRASASFEGQPRPRVEFSDTLEYIPRPLSTISSETSSSLSTIRPNHSLTGSITSIVSAGTSSPPSAKATRSALDTMFEVDLSQPRPKTASPSMRGSEQQLQLDANCTPPKRPSSSSATEHPSAEARDPHSWGNFTNDDDPSDAPHVPFNSMARDNTQIDHYSVPESSKPQHSGQLSSTVGGRPSNRPRTSPEPKRAKKQIKVKSWAGSILARRPRQRDTKEKRDRRRSPTVPLRNLASESEFRLEDVNFDVDTTCVIKTPPLPEIQSSRIQTDIQSWKPRASSPVSDLDSSGSMLDLDAALGSSSLGADPDDAASGGFSVARRRMHSSGATGGFSGPGMHYHRRAESAPEMMAINYHAFGFPRLSSNPAMADVFEEEEEEEDHGSEEEGATTPHQEDDQESNLIPGLGVNVVDADSTHAAPMLRRKHRESIAAATEERSMPEVPLVQKCSAGSLRRAIVHEETNTVEIVHADEEPRASVVTKSSDESTITPTLSHEIRRPASAPIDFAMSRTPHCFMTPESSSCVSSPDFNRTSFDVPRMHTASSSITDRATLSSSRTGEHGLSMRGSVDDVPSLISSASTMMSAHPPRFSSSAGTRSSDDPAPTVSAAVPRRTRYESVGKRSSLASLSRLVGSSYGEKSKLSIEERAQPDSTEKTERKKGNRMSRLMRFLGNPRRN
ncbi:hypothetical protein MMC07_009434 [Pseudocyphellaria aurata]|nr:hypothetical protein [Pseudocyphellaria aurata]